MYDDGKVDLDRLVTMFGGRIEYRDSVEALHVRDAGDFTIFVPQFTSSARDRFTIAHELGHYFLHYRFAGHSDERTFGRGQRNRAETEANVFASALLMPKDEFRRQWRASAQDEWKVANYFDVSPAAAKVRAQVLDLS
ncbi:ImmA/IrrE family metallo-endopeptidase [Tsukamurella sp. NPDC003166]|uniref:ImmA/IrrE family metallo-endopeptidase n=1 Tax=Tsukamurella sp. NPDC003166 TaxID=3154444 RepID=UPI0033A3FF56